MEVEEAPFLKLLMLQGPREGEALEFPPGTSILIGRVARGNTLSIKDAGISSKHLSIQTESGKWVLRDLHSSNGTILDGNKIPPNTPFTLNHAASIKIGEFTSIHVTHAPKQQCKINESGHAGRPENTRVTRNTKKKEVEEPKNNRVTRNSKKQQSVVEITDSSVGEEKVVEEPKKTRVTRNSKKEKSVVEISDSEEKVLEEPKKTRVTRNSKKEQSVVAISSQNSDLECRVENVEAKKKRGGGRRKKLNEECAQVAELEDARVDEVEPNRDGVGGGVKETCDDEREVQEENLNGNEDWPDLEKMTLAEWFDFLEVHLPKQIIDGTEEMILSMRQKAETLREYIIQHKNDKGKMPV